jgi:hypothetical protein
MEEDPAPKSSDKTEAGASGPNPLKIPRRKPSTPSLDLLWLRHKEPPCAR